MRFQLTLNTLQSSQHITLNYQYSLSAAIYKIIQRADEDYAMFLHEHGYQHGLKKFKLFTFSDLRTPFEIKGDRLIMRTNKATLIICFHMPHAAENFIKGLFMNRQLDIADSRGKASFIVQQVEVEKMPEISNESVLMQPISPVVVGRKIVEGQYEYVSPVENDFAMLVANNLVEKYASVFNSSESDLQEIRKLVQVEQILFKQHPRSRLITIKADTPAQTKVRGFDKFQLRLLAPAEIIAIALNNGIGMHNAMGMGCVEMIGN